MKVTEEQKEILIEFISSHTELISGKFSASFTKKSSEVLWRSLAEQLNSCIGPQKDWKAWRKTWQDLCARTKKKTAENRREASRTGGGKGNVHSISRTEKSIADILTPVAIQGLDIPTPQVVFDTAPPSPPIRSVSPVLGSPCRSSPSSYPSPRRSPRILNAETLARNAPAGPSKAPPPPVRNIIKKRNSATKAYAEHAKYLEKKIALRESYYKEKLKIMTSMAESFKTIADALVLRQF